MAAAMIVGAVYNVINAGFIGSLHDTSLLAAITFGTPLLGLVMAVGGVFGVGGGALISRLLGAAEHEPAKAGEIKHVSSFAVWGSVIAGAVLGGIGLLLLHPLVSLLGADAAAVPATSAYVAVMLAFVPVLAAAFCLEQLVRAEGAARQVMIGLIASTVANLVFDVLFILVLHWGVAGAALSMGLSNLGVVGYFAVWLQRHSEHVSLAPRWFTLSPTVLKPVFGVGVGELLQSAFLIVTSLVLNNLAAAYGDGPLAAMGVAVRIAQVPEFLVMGVTLGVLPLLAYSYGKGDRQPSRRRRCARPRSRSAASACSSRRRVFVFREQVFSAFVADPSVLAIGVTILTAQLVAMIANGFTGLITSLFQATGRALPATVMSVTQGVLFIPIVLLGNLWFGLAGIIWALTVTEGLVFVVGVVMWLASRRAIDRGLAEGSPERAEEVLEQADGLGEMTGVAGPVHQSHQKRPRQPLQRCLPGVSRTELEGGDAQGVAALVLQVHHKTLVTEQGQQVVHGRPGQAEVAADRGGRHRLRVSGQQLQQRQAGGRRGNVCHAVSLASRTQRLPSETASGPRYCPRWSAACPMVISTVDIESELKGLFAMEGARPVRAPRGTTLSAKSWATEAPLRMLMNNLDPENAERPDDLVVYGGTGKAARDWRSFDAMVRTLTTSRPTRPCWSSPVVRSA